MYSVLVVLRETTVDGQPVFVKFNGGDQNGVCEFETVQKAVTVKEFYERYFIKKGKQRGEYFTFVVKPVPIPV